MKIDEPRLGIINDDVENCGKHVQYLEHVVSGLPPVLFSKSKRERILAISSKAKRLIQIQCSSKPTETVKNYFSDVKFKFMSPNFPPALVYICADPDKIKSKSGKPSKTFNVSK